MRLAVCAGGAALLRCLTVMDRLDVDTVHYLCYCLWTAFTIARQTFTGPPTLPRRIPRKSVPYLMFEGRCDEALEFYRRAIGRQIPCSCATRTTQAAAGEGCADGSGRAPTTPEMVMRASFTVGDTQIMASDGMGSGHASFQGISLALSPANAADAQRYFDALADGGKVQMPLTKTFSRRRLAWWPTALACPGWWWLPRECDPANHTDPQDPPHARPLRPPFSSYTEVLIALYENGTPFGAAQSRPTRARQPFRRLDCATGRWRFPVLVDGDRTVVENGIVIEHLQLAHPGRAADSRRPRAALTRPVDRLTCMMAPVQHAVNAALTGNAERRRRRTRNWRKARLRAWGRRTLQSFPLADCAGASLFYADWTHPHHPLPALLRVLTVPGCWHALVCIARWGRARPTPPRCADRD